MLSCLGLSEQLCLSVISFGKYSFVLSFLFVGVGETTPIS